MNNVRKFLIDTNLQKLATIVMVVGTAFNCFITIYPVFSLFLCFLLIEMFIFLLALDENKDLIKEEINLLNIASLNFTFTFSNTYIIILLIFHSFIKKLIYISFTQLIASLFAVSIILITKRYLYQKKGIRKFK